KAGLAAEQAESLAPLGVETLAAGVGVGALEGFLAFLDRFRVGAVGLRLPDAPATRQGLSEPGASLAVVGVGLDSLTKELERGVSLAPDVGQPAGQHAPERGVGGWGGGAWSEGRFGVSIRRKKTKGEAALGLRE